MFDPCFLRGFVPCEFRNRRVTVMGLGGFGGGVAVARFLIARGALVTITDLAAEAELACSLEALAPFSPERLVLGRHEEDDFRRADFIVVNPAVPPTNPYLEIARAAGVPLTSEMNLFWQRHRGKTVAVTGSNGKSTTAAMIHAILRETGYRARLGGNIGRSLIEEVEDIAPDDWTVLELSSFQLFGLNGIGPRPELAVVTNFSPNHLDWHGSLDHYRTSKQTILRYQTPGDVAVLNFDDADVSRWPTEANRIGFGENDPGGAGVFAVSESSTDWQVRIGAVEETIPLGDWLKVPGRHNQINAAGAVAAALSAGAPLKAARNALESFAGLPHRLQWVAEWEGRRFYDDSIATTPESAIKALEAFSEPIILLAGGYDKGIDLGELAAMIARRVKAVALLGATGPVLKQYLDRLEFPETAMCPCRSFAEAVRWSADRSERGDVILLSPGCASYDWFRNFADRGEQFARLAKMWKSPDSY